MLTDFAKRFLDTIPPQEREVVEKYVVQWDLGFQAERAKWQTFKSIAEMTMNEPHKILDLYRRRGFLPLEKKDDSSTCR